MMELTAAEAKRIERLRKQLQRWAFTRWILLINTILLGVLCAEMCFLLKDFSERRRQIDVYLSALKENRSKDPSSDRSLLIDVVSVVQSSSKENFDYSVTACALLFLFSLGGAHIFILVRDWRGKTEQQLLLKLYDSLRDLPSGANTVTKAQT